MKKISFFFVSMLLFIYVFQVYVFAEEETSAHEEQVVIEEENNETFAGNETDESNDTTTDEDDDDDFFKKFDFGNVIWLNESNATSEISKYERIFVIFYSNWCHHCQQFMPEYVEASKYAEEQKIDIKFAKVDASANLNLSEEFQVEAVPAIYLIIKGVRHKYKGDRTKEALIRYMKRKINDDVFVVQNISQINEYINSSDFVLLSTLKNKESTLYKSFLNYSKTSDRFDFLICDTKDCLNTYGEDIILFKRYDEKVNKYSKEVGSIDKAEMDSVREFVGTYAIEMGGVLNITQINLLLEHRRKMLFYYRNSSLEEHTKYDKLMRELAKEYRPKHIYTATIGQELPLHENMCENFLILPRDLPAYVFYDILPNDTTGEYATIYTVRSAKKEQLTREYINKYIDDAINKKIRSDLYSEPPLENYTRNGLRYVIGRNFDKDVLDEKRSVLLTLIDGNSFDDNSDRVLEIMKNVSKRYESDDEKKIVFAYLDGSRNQARDIKLEGRESPLVYLYANTLSPKEIIQMTNKNFSTITEDDVEDFLYEKLKWGKREKVEVKKEEKKPADEGKRTEKKETDL